MHSRKKDKALSQMSRHPSRTPSPLWLTKSQPVRRLPWGHSTNPALAGMVEQGGTFSSDHNSGSPQLWHPEQPLPASWKIETLVLVDKQVKLLPCPWPRGNSSDKSWQMLAPGRKRGWFRPLKEEVHANNLPKGVVESSSLEVFRMLLGTGSSHLGSLFLWNLQRSLPCWAVPGSCVLRP